MKFGKVFVSQMVPEWQAAYMDYNYLKTLLKVHLSRQINKPSSITAGALNHKNTLRRAFSGLIQRPHHHHHHHHHNTKAPHRRGGDIEDQVILMNEMQPNELDEGHHYETMFLMSTDEGGENEVVFFRKLDEEFNKVDKFYKAKVEEVMDEAALLNKQMDALIAFRIKVGPRGTRFDWSAEGLETTSLAVGVADSVDAVATSTPASARTSRRVHIDEVQENGMSREGNSSKSGKDIAVNEIKTIYQSSVHEEEPKSTQATRPGVLEILKHVKINSNPETPFSTIKGILKVDKDRELSFSRENLQKVEEKLKQAFIEFYRNLRLLKNYSFLNLLAFSKIMKKYDKVTSRSASRSYLNMVDNSYVSSSDDVTRLIERVEATFIKHFSSSNRRKGMTILRPKVKKEKHRITFWSGFFTGCTISLLVGLILIIQIRKLFKKEGFCLYMENMFPLYSLFGFVVLHMLMYAANIYFWRHYRVNYPFIFGFKQGTELGYREVFLLSTGLSTLALISVLANLDMEMDERTKDYEAMTELVPLGLVSLVLLIIFCPFNLIYRSSRFFLLNCAFRSFCAPLYKVTLPDFFWADQLTSQIQALRSLEFYICYYGWGDFKHRQNTCKSNNAYNTFYFIIAIIPYWCRLLQSLRQFYEERNRMQGYSVFKYLSTVMAVLMRTAYSRQKGKGWWVMAWITSAIATIFNTYWDINIDWGLLQRHSKNRWLRDKLLVSHKSVYFGAMILNMLLRLAWVETVLNFQVSFPHRQTLIAIVASLEIIRRGIWNFFRLENEHLNNVGKYRAFKSVPLPFYYDENEDKDE